MSGLFGGGNNQQATRYVGIQVQSSLRGVSIGRGWGTFKAGCNLLDYVNFYSQKVKNSGGGKGGGSGKSGGASYNYYCNPLLGIVGQQIYGIRSIWRDSNVFIDGTSSSTSLPAPFAQAVYSLSNQQSGTSSVSSTTSSTHTSALAQAGLSLAVGANGQAPCSALTSGATTTYYMFNPNQDGTYLSDSHSLGYSGMAYVYASNYALNSGATIPNHSFEVQTTVRQIIAGITQDDGNPADIVNDFLPSVPQWPSGIIGSTAALHTYTLAAGLLISPYLDSQRAGSDLLQEILACSNSDAVWSDGALKFVPYGDTAITGNGVTFTPNLTPVYNLQLSDILDGGGDDPIKWAIRPQAQCYNSVQVEFYDRSNQYVTDIQPASDQANIDQYGLNKQDPVSLHSICLRSVAAQIAQLLVQRSCYIRRTCTFMLPETFGLLDPMDIITVPLRSGGLRLVRILEADEKDGAITITAEEMLVGSTHAALYTRQSAIPAFQSYNADPGSVTTPVVIHPPASLVSDNEVWLAAAHNYPLYGGAVVFVSTDGTNYNPVGTINGPSTYGVLTASLPTGSNPDTAHTLAVDMSLSGMPLETVTAADATGGVTLALIDNELVTFQTATVTGTNLYNLTTLQRGYGGTTIAAHSAGAPIVFLHGALFKYQFNSTQLGSTLYFKLQAFNCYGAGFQNMADLPAYSVTLAQTYVNDVAWADISGVPGTGANACVNSEFRQGALGWAENAGATCSITAPSGTGYMNTFTGTYPGTLGAGAYFDPISTDGCWNDTFAPNSYLMPIPPNSAGAILFASALLGQQYCTAELFLLIFDATGSLLEAPGWTGATDFATDGYVGNGDPVHYSQVGGVYNLVHSTARWAALMVRGQYNAATNAANPSVFASRLQMGFLATGQTTIPIYQPGQANPYATTNVIRGAWLTATAYTLGDVVYFGGASYSCLTAHTSSSGNEPPSSVWQVFAAAGANPVVGYLTNTAVTLPADSAGTVLSFAAATGQFEVFSGTSDVTSSATFAGGAQTNCTASISSSGAYSVTALSAPSGTFTMTATYGGITITQAFTVTAAPAGAAGSNGASGPTGPQGPAGSNGLNGTRTAEIEMYQWAYSAPTTFPSGTSTYTWADKSFTAPATTNGWTEFPGAPVAGDTLYGCTAVYSDSASSSTSTVTWTTSTAYPLGVAGVNGANGADGANGTRIAILNLYQWASILPTTYPSGTSTYTWSNATFSAPSSLNGWTQTPGAPVAGDALWTITQAYSDSATSATSTVTWSSSSPYATGAAGPGGPVVLIASTNGDAFTFIDGAASPSSQTLNFIANRQNTSGAISWSSSPGVTLTVTGAGNVNAALALADFGGNSQVAITATDSTTGVSDTITVVKLGASTAAAGATVGAPVGTLIAGLAAGDVASTINSGGGVAANQVNTASITASSVTSVVSSFSAGTIGASLTPGGATASVQSATITVTASAILIVSASASLSVASLSGVGVLFQMNIYVDGADCGLGVVQSTAVYGTSSATTTNGQMAVTIPLAGLSAGSHTIDIMMTAATIYGTPSSNPKCASRSLTLLQGKR